MFTIQTNLPRIAVAAILAGVGWVPGLRAVAAGARVYLLCLPWRERTIAAPRSALIGRPAGILCYTLVELVMFRDKLRVTEPMNEMTKGLIPNPIDQNSCAH